MTKLFPNAPVTNMTTFTMVIHTDMYKGMEMVTLMSMSLMLYNVRFPFILPNASLQSDIFLFDSKLYVPM